jgi:outer membrane lipoprotein-sorting protein
MSMISRRTALALTGAAALAGAPALAQDQRVLTEVSKYLNQLSAIKGRFTQINADGSRSAGDYYLMRPGRIRFEYDGDQAMVISSGTNVAIFDAKATTKVQRYPLSQTPLRFLLADRIDLTRQNMALGTGSKDGYTTVKLQDPENPGDGSMTLTLRNRPPTLTEWAVTDASGGRTRVILESLEYDRSLSPQLFNIEAEARRWN